MTTKYQQQSTYRTAGTASRLFLVLLFFVGISALAVAQTRYTVNRPVTTMSPAPRAVPIQDELAEYVPQHTTPVNWETDYEHAMQSAKLSSRNLLIYLSADENTEIHADVVALPIVSGCRKFDTVVLDDCFVRAGLCQYVLLKLPMDTKITGEDGTATTIYALPGFEHMVGHPGLIVLDFDRRDEPYYGEVVGILPFLRGESPTASQTETFLELPPGTLTQRTLTYAVRIHPDRPLSADGEPASIVMQMASEHALYQAERGVITHQNFSHRSSRCQAELGSGTPAEICAQSQPGLGLFEGAISSMRAWRNSPAHWSIAKRNQRYYGYDMVRGKNGAWYAVGFFINN
ncbi:MAG: hypothetical protein FWE95_07330 [Planctomycetaceae bacterium]|nr:hypothetical protein [Planctomycetaceae bacterium]